MPEYNVHHTGYVSHVETIEADSPEEAMDASEVGFVSLCNQCAREWDAGGDPEIFNVTDAAGEVVWEQEPASQPVVDREAVLDVITDFTREDAEFALQHASALADAILALLTGSAK